MKFEKVSEAEADECRKRISGSVTTLVSDVPIPRRSTEGSAGYDFHSPAMFDLNPGETVRIPLMVKVTGMPKDCVLCIYNRSGLSLLKGLRLDNAVGIIDSDYHECIWYQATNCGDSTIHVMPGDKICQGVFTKVVLVDDDDALECRRTGGLGSTGR